MSIKVIIIILKKQQAKTHAKGALSSIYYSTGGGLRTLNSVSITLEISHYMRLLGIMYVFKHGK